MDGPSRIINDNRVKYITCRPCKTHVLDTLDRASSITKLYHDMGVRYLGGSCSSRSRKNRNCATSRAPLHPRRRHYLLYLGIYTMLSNLVHVALVKWRRRRRGVRNRIERLEIGPAAPPPQSPTQHSGSRPAQRPAETIMILPQDTGVPSPIPGWH